MRWFFVLLAILAVIDAVSSYANQHLGVAICDSVIIFILLLITFFLSRQSKRKKP